MTVHVSIVYPADPLGNIPGGIDTCIRDVIRWAPDDITFSLIGATTDRNDRPLRVWKACSLGRRSFQFYPAIAIDNPERQSKIPVTFRFLLSLIISTPKHRCNLLQFHRLEPSIPFLGFQKPKVTFIHQNMEVLRNKSSDIRWRHAPWIYYKLEDILIRRFASIFVVREDAVKAYRERYPELAHKISFLPTWMNPEIFYPLDKTELKRFGRKFFSQFGMTDNQKVLVSVGRLDRQKNPIRLIESFSKVIKNYPNARLIVIGDGVLRQAVEEAIRIKQLSEHVKLVGLLHNQDVADWLRIADLLVLSSDYEGMPRCVIEALGCGVPVATTDVGEVHRVVHSGINGEIAHEHSVEGLTDAILNCLEKLDVYRGVPCVEAASKYIPEKVLEPVYEKYRYLVNSSR
jgi:glycosyltransferase involved in cell wall biosynthesis